MKILFIGCVKSSYVLLKELLLHKKNICGVVTREKSKFNADFEDLTPLCEEYNVALKYTNDINDSSTIRFVKEMNPDVIYCFGWSQLLKSEIMNIPRLGVVGFHPAKLPYNRGRHPIIWALVLGLPETASTFFMIDERVDSGAIISQAMIKIDFEDDASILYKKILAKAKKQVLLITDQFEHDSVEYIYQNNIEGNTWRKRSKEDGKIDFRMSSINIYNLVRGLTRPYVGAHFEFNGKEYKVWKCEIVREYDEPYDNFEFGKVLKVYSPTSFLVRSGDYLVKILKCDENDLKVGDYL